MSDAIEVDEDVVVGLHVSIHRLIAARRHVLHPEQMLERQIHVRVDEIALSFLFYMNE